MTANRAWPTSANFSGTPEGTSVTDKLALEGNLASRLMPEPTTNIGGTANAVTADLLVSEPAAFVQGNMLTVVPTADNTAAVTLNVNAKGAVAVKTASGAALAAGQWKADVAHLLQHDGTNWRVLSPPLDFIYGPEVAAEEEPTSDVTEIEVTGLSIYRDIKGFATGRVNGAATLYLRARETSGTWRLLGSLAFGSAADFVLRFDVANFNSATKPKVYQGWIDSDVGSLTRSTETMNAITPPSPDASWYTYQEVFDEFKLEVSASSIEGTDPDKRAYLRIEGQR